MNLFSNRKEKYIFLKTETGSSSFVEIIMGKSTTLAIISAAVLSIVYIGVLSFFESFEYAITQFVSLWYWMVPLVAGFGFQVGLYSHIRISSKAMVGKTNGVMASSGGVSTTSMIICCLHHLADVLPLVGLSAAAVFLTAYQPVFLALGVFSNLAGIAMMLTIIQTNNLVTPNGRLTKLFRYDMMEIRNMVFVFSIIFMVGLTGSQILKHSLNNEDIEVNQTLVLDPIIEEANGITFTIAPVAYSDNQSLLFDIRIDTHRGSLDFNLEEIVVLETSNGNEYIPLSWDGSPAGGHHRSGRLSFPIVDEDISFKLMIYGVGGISERVFMWTLDSSDKFETNSITLIHSDLFFGSSLIAAILTLLVINSRRKIEKPFNKYDRLLRREYNLVNEKNE